MVCLRLGGSTSTQLALVNAPLQLTAFVHGLVASCVQMKDEAMDGNKAAAEAAAQRGNLLMNALWSIVGGGRAAESSGKIFGLASTTH